MRKTHHIEEISEIASGKLAFVQQKYGKRLVIRWSGKDVKRDNKVKVSKHIMNCESDKRVHERSELFLQQFTEISRLDNKDLYTVHGDKKVNTSYMPKLTVKDLSRILCPSLSDNKEMRCLLQLHQTRRATDLITNSAICL